MDQTDKKTLLELDPQPAYLVSGGVITLANEAALQRQFIPGTDVASVLRTGKEEYSAFQSGCLYLSVAAADTAYDAFVTELEDAHLFRIDLPQAQEQLQVLALAAQELRLPLSTMLTVADRLVEESAEKLPQSRQELSQLNRSIYQLLRIVTNMSDAYRYATSQPQMETVNLTALFEELLEKTASLTEGRCTVDYEGPGKDLFAQAQPGMLSQAVYNLLGNAIKFAKPGSRIQAKLEKQGNTLRFSVSSHTDTDLKSNLFTRYRRQPGIEDGRMGIGLGMALVRSAAAAHGGTVLMDRWEDKLRFTVTLDLKQRTDNILRTSTLKIDPLGGLDAGLIHLADALDAQRYLP